MLLKNNHIIIFFVTVIELKSYIFDIKSIMFHKVVSLLSKQNLDDNVDINLLKEECMLISDVGKLNNCGAIFVNINEYSPAINKRYICCHGKQDYEHIDTHNKLISWRLFGIINFIYYSGGDTKISLINNLLNIIDNNKDMSDEDVIERFITSSQTELDYKLLSSLSTFIFKSKPQSVHYHSTNEDKLSETYYNNTEETNQNEFNLIQSNRYKILNSLFNRLNNIINDETETKGVGHLTECYYLLNIMSQDNTNIRYFNDLDGEIKIINEYKLESDNDENSESSDLI